MKAGNHPGHLKALVLTKDHLAIYPSERSRIEKAGGHVTADGRLNGRIQVKQLLYIYHVIIVYTYPSLTNCRVLELFRVFISEFFSECDVPCKLSSRTAASRVWKGNYTQAVQMCPAAIRLCILTSTATTCYLCDTLVPP